MKASFSRNCLKISVTNPLGLKHYCLVGNANILYMPQLSPTMMKGTISKWYVKKYQKIREYELICDISTDNLTQIHNNENHEGMVDDMEVEVQEDAYVAYVFEIAAKVGSVVTVDIPIAILCDEKIDVDIISSIIVENNLEYFNNNLILRKLFPRALWQAYSKKKVSEGNCGCM